MADLNQALKWLIEGKRIRKSGWNICTYLFLNNNRIVDELGVRCERHLDGDEWELYIEKPHHYESTCNLEDDAECIVWDDFGTRAFAYWDSEDKAFRLLEGHSFVLKVAKWKKFEGID